MRRLPRLLAAAALALVPAVVIGSASPAAAITFNQYQCVVASTLPGQLQFRDGVSLYRENGQLFTLAGNQTDTYSVGQLLSAAVQLGKYCGDLLPFRLSYDSSYVKPAPTPVVPAGAYGIAAGLYGYPIAGVCLNSAAPAGIRTALGVGSGEQRWWAGGVAQADNVNGGNWTGGCGTSVAGGVNPAMPAMRAPAVRNITASTVQARLFLLYHVTTAACGQPAGAIIAGLPGGDYLRSMAAGAAALAATDYSAFTSSAGAAGCGANAALIGYAWSSTGTVEWAPESFYRMKATTTCRDATTAAVTTQAYLTDVYRETVQSSYLPATTPQCASGAYGTAYKIERCDVTGSSCPVTLLSWTADPSTTTAVSPSDPNKDCYVWVSGATVACSMALKKLSGSTEQNCFLSTVDCSTFPTNPGTGTAPATGYRCYYGVVQVDVRACLQLPTSTVPSVTSPPTSSPTSTSSPSSSSSTGSGSGIDPSATYSFPTGTAGSVGGAVAPVPDPGTSCMGGIFSLNPLDWVVKPVKCVLSWAFVPDSLGISEGLTGLSTAWGASGPGQAATAFSSGFSGFVSGYGDGCSGGLLDFDTVPGVGAADLSIGCAPPGDGWQSVRSLLGVGVYGVGLWGLWQKIGRFVRDGGDE